MAKAPGRDACVLSKTGAFPAISAKGPVIAAWQDGATIRTDRLD